MNKLSRIFFSVFIILYANFVLAQLATVTGQVSDATGTPATSGYVSFTLMPNSNSYIYYVNGVTQVVPTTVKCGINGSGLVKNLALSGACQVYGVDVLTPANLSYTMVIAPANVPTTKVTNQLIISTVGYSINSPVFQPNFIMQPQIANVSTFPFGTNVVPTGGHIFTVGSALLPYAYGYFDNINVSTNFVPLGGLTVGATGTLASVVQHKRGTGSINGGATSEVLITWTNAFVNTNYTVVCSVEDGVTGATLSLTLQRIRTKSTTQVGGVISNSTGGALTATLDCIAYHD